MDSNKHKKPPFLTVKARKYWDFLIEMFQDIEAFHSIDTLQLGILCNSLQDYAEATKVLEKAGRYYTTGSGLHRLHPANQVQGDSLKTIKELGAAFGLNFKSRESLLNVFALKREMDELDRIL